MKPSITCAFSDDRKHRYSLWREVDMYGDGFVQFIGLNPSTAYETKDDPTIRRCKDFAVRWGYKAMCMTNLFAFRATDPADMKKASDPVGMENDPWLLDFALFANLVVAAWGVHGSFKGRDKDVLKMLRQKNIPVYHLGLTIGGHPKHPLYLPAITKPEPFKFNP